MILITGATGKFGNATIDCLLEKGTRLGTIAALVREKKKGMDLLSKGIILRIGDFDKYASLVDAFYGVDKLLLVSGTDPEKRGKQHENAIRAAKEAGVEHIFYIRYERNYEIDNSSFAFLVRTQDYTENIIKESGIPYTIFRNNVYTGTQPFYLGKNVSETDVVFPAAEALAAITPYREMAEATANLLVSDGYENKEFDLLHTENISSINSRMY
jgi:NAD(P)H dehydrogenase (quinone)